MTPEQQRIAIAKACGWKMHTVAKDDPYTCTHCGIHYSPMIWREWEIPYLWCKKNNETQSPDYLNDLNAMHDAEEVLTNEQDLEYSEALEQVVEGRFVTNNAEDMRRLRSATASQRAEAFLRTIGKWEESR